MFKLFKDLTRPPETLVPPPSASGSSTPSLSYTARQRARSPAPALGGRTKSPAPSNFGRSPAPSAYGESGWSGFDHGVARGEEEEDDDVEETVEDAKHVVRLLRTLKEPGERGDVMRYVETFSQLLSIQGRFHTHRAFRRHGGFKTLLLCLNDGLAWISREDLSPEISEDEWQVREVQRMEGVRLALEVLGWALGSRQGESSFKAQGGYMSLLSTLYRLVPHQGSPRTKPESKIVALLLAHICHDNYSILSLYQTPPSRAEMEESAPSAVAGRLGDVVVREASAPALRLLWAYLWSEDAKGKGKARVWSDELENVEGDGQKTGIVEMTIQSLLVAAQASTSNLFAIVTHLPVLADFLMTRLYGTAERPVYEVTFPPRDDWMTGDTLSDNASDEEEWQEPRDGLRKVYFALLKRLLEAGVDQTLTWRLFVLVKTTAGKLGPSIPTTSAIGKSGQSSAAASTPSAESDISEGGLVASPTRITNVPQPLAKARPKMTLQINTEKLDEDEERLHPEIMELIRHSLKSKTPDVFVFRAGRGESPGGMELQEMGGPWMNAHKGFNFSCWIYISKLNQPLVLLHMSQKQSKHPLFQIRILESSQIGITSYVHGADIATTPSADGTSTASGPTEYVCGAWDALIPHHQWVHFAIGSRKIRSTEQGELRIFVNGVRVGAMRIAYPVPAPPTVPPGPPQLHAKPTSPPDAVRIAIGREYSLGEDDAESKKASPGGREEENEWMLGRTLLIEEAIAEDLILLLHHLGPRYSGNLQEPAGRFLTYEGATSINIYLSSLAQAASDKRLFTQANNSLLVKAIRQGPAIPEESIVLSLSARDYDSALDVCVNAGTPHPYRAKQLRFGTARLVGNVRPFASTGLDDSVEAVGGGLVLLKMVDLSKNKAELVSTLTILKDTIKESWRASEEMERIHGFELLAAILRPKMSMLMDEAGAKVILAMLGINMDKSNGATVHNSSAYRSLGLEFELWCYAPDDVVIYYLKHFGYLLSTSKHKRFNILRTFQKSAMVRKLLYALRSGLFSLEIVPNVVDVLRLALEARWSGEDGIKPVFSYLVSALCQSNASFVFSSSDEPSPVQLPAALVLKMIAELCQDRTKLVKLNRSIALHRLLVIFLSSNSTYFVVIPCLDILHLSLTTPGLENSQRSFESEGGFALLGNTLPPIWRSDIQTLMMKMIIGEGERTSLLCSPLVACLLAAIDALLQQSAEGDEGSSRPFPGRTRSGTITSLRSTPFTPLSPDGMGTSTLDDSRLEDLLREITAVYRASKPFRKAITAKRVEGLLPNIADFAAVSSSGGKPEVVIGQRQALADWLEALVELGKLPHPLINQMNLLVEQLRTAPSTSRRMSSSSFMSTSSLTSLTSPRPNSSYVGQSFSNRFGSSPSAMPASPRRRPSTDIPNFPRSRSIREQRVPLKRVLTGESILEGGKDKNAAWKMIIMQTDNQAHSKMTLDRKEHWHRLSQLDWPKLASALRAENGLWPEREAGVTWRLDGSEGPLRMRARLERINAVPEQGLQRTRHKLRDAIPSVDELSSAVSRINAAPWEDPFALALGDTTPIAEEEPLLPTSSSNTALSAVAAGPVPGSSTPVKPASAGASTSTNEVNDEEEDFEMIGGDIEDDKDDKMRRIAKTLQAGDKVEEAHNIVRIVGVDACPGLLILGKKNLYLVDGLVQTAAGEVIDAKDAQKDVLSIPSGTLVELDAADQQSHRWSYNEIVENNKRAFLFRDVALELYFSDKRNFLIVFNDKRQRQAVVQRINSKNDQRDAISRSVIGNFVLDTVAKAMDRSEQQLEALQRKWQHREISNFAYLQLLNQYANRTPNDVTQYPVFPWVLADYTSKVLDLDSETTFRNLTYPMGALTAARREAAIERYSATEGVGEKPFHYGTHYSSSMIVCGFMIRMSPFTEIFLALQGGNFDLADRLFSSVPRAWDSASADNRGDVRELIPEFYYSGAFLRNINRHDFGKKQASGDPVDDVVLPPWAMDDPLLFIHRHREALESDYVSRHLASWIDLTFGCKQRDPNAYNCFHPLSYRGAIDLENIEDEGEKAASTAIIHNFGQTPLQIFKLPHPHRFVTGGKSTLPIHVRFGVAEHWHVLFRSVLPITESPSPIDDITPPSGPDMKPKIYQRYRINVPGSTYLTIQYGFTDGSMRIYYQDSAPKLVTLVEGIFAEHAIFAAPSLLVAVSTQGVITAWRLNVKGSGYRKGDVALQREATLRGHARKVTCLAANTGWSLLVSGSEDGNAMVWDTNRLRYTRTLQTGRSEPILYCAIHEADGQIALASKSHIYLFSLNGHPIAATSVGITEQEQLFSYGLSLEEANEESQPEFTGGISFLNREFLGSGVMFVIGVGSEIALYRCEPGVVNTYEVAELEEGEIIDKPRPWTLVEQGRLFRSDDHPGGDCCMAKFIGETLYGAFKPSEDKNKYSLYQWSLPEGAARHVAESVSHTCMAERCGRHFGLLEPKRHCGGCGGAFCGTHALHVETFTMRYCESCRTQLSIASSQGIFKTRRDTLSVPGSGMMSRRGSLSIAGAGSRRPSISAAGGKGTVSQAPSRRGSGEAPSPSPAQTGTATPSRTVQQATT